MPVNTPRTHIRVVRSDNREFPSMAIAYRELLGTAQELSMSEHQRIRSEIRVSGASRDRHGFTWRAMGGAVSESTINWTDFTFGVELELLAPFEMSSMQRMVPSGWRVVRDGSLSSAPGYVAMEVVSPVLQGPDGLLTLKQVMDKIREAGCKVNASCGMHVHVGVRGMAPVRVRKIAMAFLNAEQHFDAIVPPSRRDNRYCGSNAARVTSYRSNDLAAATTIRGIADVMNGGNSHEHYNHFRYFKLNFQSFVHHGTIEFRQHAGTVESDKACAWVRLITGFCARAAAEAQETFGTRLSFEQWIARVTDEAGQRYMAQRRAKFAAATSRVAA